MQEHLTIKRAAELLSVSQDTIRRMLPELGAVEIKHGPAGRRTIRIPEKALEAYLDGCRILPPQPVRTKPVKAGSFRIERRRA